MEKHKNHKRYEHGQRLRYYLPNVLVTLVLSFLIFGLTFVILFFNVLLKPETYTDQMYKSKVDEIAFNEIYEYFDRQYNYTGVAPDTLKNSTDHKDVSAAIYAYVDSTFDYINGKSNRLPEFEYDFKPLEKNLHKDYEDWALENNKKLDSKTEAMEQKTLKNVKEFINSKLDIMMFSTLNKENGFSTKLRNSLGKVKAAGIGVAVGVIIFIGLIWLINRKHGKYSFYWISCGCFCASMMMIIPSAILKITKYFDGLVIKNESMYNAFVKSLYSVNDKILICGIILFAISAAVMLLFVAASKNMFRFKYRK